MATIINASNSTGLTLTSDLSGEVNLQANGSTTATVNATAFTAKAFVPSSSTVPTSGMYLAAANTIAFSSGTTEAMRLSSTGSLLIGQTATSAFKVRVNSVASIETGDGTDGGNYGVVQVVRPASQSDNVFGLSFIRQGNKIAGMGFLQNSDTFAIQSANSNSGAGVTLTNAATSWGSTSDERKKDITGILDNALAKLADWRSVYFKYKTDTQEDPQRVGLIAQEVQATLPEAVSVETDEIGTLQLRYTETIPLLVKAIQELNAKVDAQAKEIAALKAGK